MSLFLEILKISKLRKDDPMKVSGLIIITEKRTVFINFANMSNKIIMS